MAPRGVTGRSPRRTILLWSGAAAVAAAVVTTVVLTRPPARQTASQPILTVPSVQTVIPSPNIKTANSPDMTSRETGWMAWGSVHKQGKPAVARTTDQGRRWINVTPRTDLVGAKLSLDPVGARKAFLVVIHPGKSAIVYVTADGGKTWTQGQRVPVLYGDGGAHLAARGKDVWLEVGGAAHDEAAQLFTSRDGGMTWRLVAKHAPNGLGTLPGFGWLVFTSAQDGFTCSNGENAGIFRTDNGGAAWTPVSPGHFLQVDLPEITREYGLAAVYLISPPSFFPEFLRTTNGGQSWSVVIGPSTPEISLEANVDVLNADTAMYVDVAGDIRRTTNCGRSWQTIPLGASSKALLHGNIIISLTFGSQKVGWAVMTAKTVKLKGPQTLYLTTDGGRSWKAVAK
ncbi:MAG: hypothetical protein M0Z66_13595 [Thermaerobacter sp.]|nr:hypothetical protein [Thermaerobacter sp.]